jgi:hypothetical protein
MDAESENQGSCGECRYGKKHPTHSVFCLRYPPQMCQRIEGGNSDVVDWFFPVMHPDQWCGEFQPKGGTE